VAAPSSSSARALPWVQSLSPVTSGRLSWALAQSFSPAGARLTSPSTRDSRATREGGSGDRAGAAASVCADAEVSDCAVAEVSDCAGAAVSRLPHETIAHTRAALANSAESRESLAMAVHLLRAA